VCSRTCLDFDLVICNSGDITHMSAPTIDHTLDEILKLAASHFKVPREKLTPDDDFFKTLGIDSLQALDLLTRIEHHFRIELPDYELQGVSDFRTLANRIQARL
jgi:acyl carrier protein